jgi:hypothetical protein
LRLAEIIQLRAVLDFTVRAARNYENMKSRLTAALGFDEET